MNSVPKAPKKKVPSQPTGQPFLKQKQGKVHIDKDPYKNPWTSPRAKRRDVNLT